MSEQWIVRGPGGATCAVDVRLATADDGCAPGAWIATSPGDGDAPQATGATAGDAWMTWAEVHMPDWTDAVRMTAADATGGRP